MNTTEAPPTTQERDAAHERYRTRVIPAAKLRVINADTAQLNAECPFGGKACENP